jgi:dihydrofolate reductase
MRQLINSTYITLDGVIESRHPWRALECGTSAEGEVSQSELLDANDIALLGRRTYEVIAGNVTERPSDLLYRAGTTSTFDLVDSRVLSNGIVATYAV